MVYITTAPQRVVRICITCVVCVTRSHICLVISCWWIIDSCLGNFIEQQSFHDKVARLTYLSVTGLSMFIFNSCGRIFCISISGSPSVDIYHLSVCLSVCHTGDGTLCVSCNPGADRSRISLWSAGGSGSSGPAAAAGCQWVHLSQVHHPPQLRYPSHTMVFNHCGRSACKSINDVCINL